MILFQGKEKLLVDVIKDVIDSFHCHTGWSTNCNHSSLLVITIILTVSYVTLILSSLELMKTVQSTVTLISILMPALPVSSLFWSLFRLNEQLPSEFSIQLVII